MRWIYKATSSYVPEFSASLYGNRTELASILSSFSFTLLGFLAAVIAILLGFSNTGAFRTYRRSKYLSLFFFVYAYCLFTLTGTFAFSILTLAKAKAEMFMTIALILATNSVVQVLIIGVVIANICRRSLGR